MKMVIERGPWMIRTKPLLVQKWNPNVCVEKKDPEVIPLWIKLYNVPLEAWSNKGISALASSLGKPIIMDQTTTKMCNEGVGSIGTEEEKRQVDSGNVNQNVRKDNGALGDLCYHTLDIIRVARMLFVMALCLGSIAFMSDPSCYCSIAGWGMMFGIMGSNVARWIRWWNVDKGLVDAVRRSANKSIIGWNGSEVTVMVIHTSDHTMLCLVEIVDLKRNSIVDNNPWVLMGDWNVILNVKDHSAGGSCKTADMIDIKECIKSIEVGDLHYFGLHYTWIQSRLNPANEIFKKLDRVLGNISFMDACDMIRSVSNEEIKEEMFDIEDNKAPGPDGYTSKFFKKAWTMVGDDVCMVIKEFFATSKLFGKVNATVISLVPKLDTPFKVSDFRPIACCNVVYKCISKILTKRIKKYLCKVFSQNQSAFIPGRQIIDNILITQELLRGYNWKNGARRVSFKIDILKAYDNVNWSFLRQTLMLFGFPKDMIGWIMTCVSTANFSINVNKDRHGYFKGGRGLRKGDPISHYLFTLVMEMFNIIV
ncbi:RNA-directed DNA polymerase, eukaryota, reverse transcriptase zinc-binding domain protein [Tanacetum coccineum]